MNTELKSQSVERFDLNTIFQKANQIERVRTLIIHQKGETLGEKSFDGRNLSHPFNIKSASKRLLVY